jgi:cytochrome oxidase assembly protein ShyY1
VANCPGLEQAAIIELHAIEGGPGRRWISPCRLTEGPYAAILVDRGFVPEGVVPPPVWDGRTSRPVVGVLREAEKGSRFSPPPSADVQGGMVWYRRDAKAMNAAVSFAGRSPPSS